MAKLDQFFALSTCVHCRHTQDFLEQNHVPFKPIFVDQLQGEAREEALEEMRQYNPNLSFPTLVFDDGRVIVGFRKDEIASELGV